MISDEGISVDPKKIKVVRDWKRPTIVTEIRSFLGLVGYYRWFVENFSKIAMPLTKLTQKISNLLGQLRAKRASMNSRSS